MGELIDMEGARALVADQTLWPLVRDFLWDFAPQIHSSWLEGQVAGSTDQMSSPRVKAWVLKELGVEPCFCVFPKDDWSRLLLLDGAMLESIAKWLGALVCADSLRRVTDGKVVRELKAALPGIYPEVFGYTAYFKGSAKTPEGERRDGEESDVGSRPSNVESVISAGWNILSSALSHLPDNLLRRLALKLPKSFQPPDGQHSTADIPAFDSRMISKLLKLKFPEAYSLCCS